MNIYTDPEPLAVDTVVDFEGFLVRVSILESEFRTLFRAFEETLEDAEDIFNADILESYHQKSVYFIPKDEDDRGLSCRVLNSTSTQWIDGQLHFKPVLIYRQTPEKSYNISLIPYDNRTIIEVGNKTITPDNLIKPYLNDLKGREKYLSGDLREFLEKENKILISPDAISDCVEVRILQPGQDWISCKMDLHLALRLYQAESKNSAWQASYCNPLKSAPGQSPKTDSLLQIGESVTSIDEFCGGIARQFRLFEEEYKNNKKYYPSCPNLEKDIISRLRMSSKFKLLRGKQDDNGLPCQLLNLNSGHWVKGDLAFELMPFFLPDPTSEASEDTSPAPQIYQSPLDDIRQSLLNELKEV